MPDPTPYGEWPAPLSAADVAGDTVDFGGVDVADGTALWLERRPSEGGRGVVVAAAPDGTTTEVTPGDHDVRTTVHEYGGGDFAVHDDVLVYSRFADQRLYRTGLDGSDDATPITPEPPEDASRRYADVAFTPAGDRLYAVQERHDGDDAADEAVNQLVTLPADGSEPPTVVASGHDFYSFPRLDPAGDRLAWTTWDHPDMPWDATALHVADLRDDGTLADERTVLGGDGGEESVFQPSWSPDGTLHAVSDRSGWWLPYRVAADGHVAEDGHAAEDGPVPLVEEAAEYGTPQWAFGLATTAHLDDGRTVAVRNQDGRMALGYLDEGFTDAGLPYDAYPHPRLATDGETVATIAAGPTTPPTVVRWTPGDGHEELRRAFELSLDPDAVSEPDHVTFPTGADGEAEAHALYYPPTNPDVEPPADESPPVVVWVHGGPTSQTLPIADLEKQFFTSRGVGVLDVNYRGSTGHGRAYRDALDGEWGVVDTQDCVAAAQHLASEGRADPDRLGIRGGSAGGYATLCALAFHDAFDAGASYYGVGDLRALAEHTHKFESRYLDGLVGPLPEAEAVYEDRSPVAHADGIAAPLLVLQGGEDRVVPVEQAETLVDALVDTGTPYEYVEFPAERHGFRTATARETALEVEFAFYAAVFGFTPADPDLAPLALREGERGGRTVETDAD